jgi:DNA-binding SARP family transcriptional activator
MHGPWRIELFGGLRARNGERTIERFRSQKTGSLLGYLAFHRDRMHSREVLVELLWPGCEPEAGRSRLSTALWFLRRQLEPPGTPSGAIFLADRAAVGLNPEAVTTDVAEFERLLRAVRGEPGPGRTRLLAEAVEKYGGEFLAGYYEDWIFPEQGRLNELFHEALAELLARLEEAGEVDRALEYAWRGVRLDPLQEEAHIHLMRLQAAAGHPDLALRQYRELKRLLARELDTTPSTATQDLARRLEREAHTVGPEPAEPSPPEPSTVLPAPAPPPVGTVTFLLADAPHAVANQSQKVLPVGGPNSFGGSPQPVEASVTQLPGF